MLEDDLVDRYSRQILLPEVGGRGQERLCATRATVTGSGRAAAFAATLLGAAGVQVECHPGDVHTIAVRVDDAGIVVGRAAGEGGTVVTLVGRPCLRCVGDDTWPTSPSASGEIPQAIGALVAAEALRVALGLAASGRVQTLETASEAHGGRPIDQTAGCDACAPAADPSRI